MPRVAAPTLRGWLAPLRNVWDTRDGTPLLGVWLFLVFDILLYAFLAWYLDQVVPMQTETGESKPWSFCLPSWCQREPPLPADLSSELKEELSARASHASAQDVESGKRKAVEAIQCVWRPSLLGPCRQARSGPAATAVAA